MRDEELYIVEVNDFVFNGVLFSEIQIPLNHINFDKNNNKRSDYSIEEAAELIIELLNNEAF